MKLLFYKGEGTLLDKFIRVVTNSKYSHIELSMDSMNDKHRCWSSSNRDKGIRTTVIDTTSGHWDIIDIGPYGYRAVESWFEEHEGLSYDYIGLLGTVIPLNIFSRKDKWFCSECIAQVLDIDNPWNQTPESIYQHFK